MSEGARRRCETLEIFKIHLGIIEENRIMRKLHLAFMVSLCFLGLSSAAGATSVNLIWTGATVNGNIVSMSGGSVLLDVSSVATLTLDVRFDVDSRGVSAIFMTVDWDVDLDNELNLISWSEMSWSNGMGTRNLSPFIAGINSSQESTGLQAGFIFEFDSTTIGEGPKNTTLTFARLVFVTNLDSVNTDGDDIFANYIIGGNGAGVTISDAVINQASVNIVPEPSTVALLGLGIASLALAGSRRNRK